MADIDKEVERIEKGDAWDKTDEVVQVEVRRPLDKVIPIRLSGDKWEELRQEARELGIGPTTLARMWILERLRLKRGILFGEQASALEPFISQREKIVEQAMKELREKFAQEEEKA